jgi:hypothetical protein
MEILFSVPPLPPLPPPAVSLSPSNSTSMPPPPMPFPNLSTNSGPGKLLSQQNASNSTLVATNENKPKPLPFPASEFYSTNSESEVYYSSYRKFLLDIVVLNFPYFFIRQFDISSVTLFLFLVFLYHIIVDIFELYLFLGTSGTFKMKLFFISISY